MTPTRRPEQQRADGRDERRVVPTCLVALSIASAGLLGAGVPVLAEAQVNYQITIEMTWSEETHPVDWPSGHSTPWYGGIHKPTVTFWERGAPASLGVKNVAEIGNGLDFRAEFLVEAAAGNASSTTLALPNINPAPGTGGGTFVIDRTFPAFTLITMIAPSPDWFAGTSGLDLFAGNRWADGLLVPIYPFDSGTDSGVTYNHVNVATIPPVPIFRIYTDPLGVGGTSPPLASYLFEILDVDGRPPYDDADSDGLTNLREAELGTDPLLGDSDADGIPDPADNCPTNPSLEQADGDGDGAGNPCDNCPAVANVSQGDRDADGTGDECDLNDGLLRFTSILPGAQAWQTDDAFTSYNLYRGDLAVLLGGGEYTQDPSAAAAERFCDLGASASDSYLPPQGAAVFYVVSGFDGASEGSLGENRWGTERLNTRPCP